MPDKGELESPRLAAILAALEGHPRVAFVTRQNTGGAYLGDPPKYVAFAYEGAADLTGMLRGDGRRLEVEVKRPGEWPTPETFARWELGQGYQGRPFKLTRRIKRLLAQKANLDAVNAGGGLAFIAYDVEDVYRMLGHPADAITEAGEHQRDYNRALVAASLQRGRGRPRGGRWHELPPGLKGREQ